MFVAICADLDNPYTINVNYYDRPPTPDDVRVHVMGTAMQLPSKPGVALWVHRLGFPLQLNSNHVGQLIWQQFGGPARTGVADWKQELVGNLVITGPLVDGEPSSLTEKQVKEIEEVIAAATNTEGSE